MKYCILKSPTYVGIGKALVKAFVKYKACKVYALSKTKENLDKLVSEEPTVIPIVVDLKDWEATKNALQCVQDPIDILCNNAGTNILEPLLEVKPESIDSLFNVNFKSIICVSQVVAQKMIENKRGGVIINASSQASKIAFQDHAVYSATKAAVDAATRAMALELGKFNIRVVATNPTVVMTELGKAAWSNPKKARPVLDRIPLHRFAEIEDVVNTIIFLASEKAGMINGANVPIEGGILAT
ncbi:L-xylulose reductase-like isoform X2 [Planococcus citri]|uniref:L-xylulose reductase-like isoform X2 n=1 Tax=Planococcus citri TaxID=170843 RepID=UPI0031F85640